jgi:hypothetical protein
MLTASLTQWLSDHRGERSDGLREGGTVLVKGSRFMGMERVVKAVTLEAIAAAGTAPATAAAESGQAGAAGAAREAGAAGDTGAAGGAH